MLLGMAENIVHLSLMESFGIFQYGTDAPPNDPGGTVHALMNVATCVLLQVPAYHNSTALMFEMFDMFVRERALPLMHPDMITTSPKSTKGVRLRTRCQSEAFHKGFQQPPRGQPL